MLPSATRPGTRLIERSRWNARVYNSFILPQRRRDMRNLICAALTAASLLTVAAALSPASAREYRYCLQGREWGYPGNCQFSTYRQCMVTASGTYAHCGINPRFAFRERGRYR
jgi:hypothetical protein